MFQAAQWCYVTPFALSKGDEFRSSGGVCGSGTNTVKEYEEQAEELIAISARLNDREKAIAEYWSDGPGTEQPPGHWMQRAAFVSARDHHSLDDDVKMFFALKQCPV